MYYNGRKIMIVIGVVKKGPLKGFKIVRHLFETAEFMINPQYLKKYKRIK